MPGTKEIRVKIASVKSTQKITKAMQMVATSKMRRAQDRMRLARPYAEKIRSVIGNLTQANPDYRSPFLVERADVKNVGFIVISSDRGLCGALNINIFKNVLLAMREWQQKGAQVSLCLIGSKAPSFFRRLPNPILANTHGPGRPPAHQGPDRHGQGHARRLQGRQDRPAVPGALALREHHDAEAADAAAAAGGARSRASQLQEHWDYIYEPDAADILDGLLMRYIESQVYRGAVENVACEMAARMVAMKAAIDNAGKLINELQLIYNKARQAAITKELAEIVGGAAAV